MPQENNMAELLRLMKTMIVKVDDLTVKVDDLTVNVDDLTVKVDDLTVKVDDLTSDVRGIRSNMVQVEENVDLLNGQFRDVAGQAMKDTVRITSLEGRVDILESKSH